MSPSSRLVVSALLLAVVGGSVWFLRDTQRDTGSVTPDAVPSVEPVPADLVLPGTIELPDPEPRITNLETVEDKSELIADWLLDLSDKLRRRDLTAAGRWFSPRFAGHSLTG